jgi:hypothetical protein
MNILLYDMKNLISVDELQETHQHIVEKIGDTLTLPVKFPTLDENGLKIIRDMIDKEIENVKAVY